MSQPDVDIFMYFGTTPPCLIPKSDRAKKLIHLPEGVDAVLTLEPAGIALAAIPEDFVMMNTTDVPKMVAFIEKLSVLH